MTKEIHDKLSKYEEQLTTAKIGGYVRKLYSSALTELDEIYTKLYPSMPASNLKTGCSVCVVKAMKKMAEDYFNYKPRNTKKKEEK